MAEYLTVSTVARILNAASETVRAWERAGKLPAIRTASGVRLFLAVDVERFAIQRARAVQGQQNPVSSDATGANDG